MNTVFYGIRCKSKINFAFYELLFFFGYAIGYRAPLPFHIHIGLLFLTQSMSSAATCN